MTTSAPSAASLEAGDRAPIIEVRAPAGDDRPQGMEGFVGRSILVLFYPPLASPDAAAEVGAFERRAGELDALGIKVLVVARDRAAPPPPESEAARVRFVYDPAAKIFAAYGLAAGDGTLHEPDARASFLLDPSLRIVARRQGAPGESHVDEVIQAYRAGFAPEEPRRLFAHAPVLLVPDVLPAALCRRLVEVWETDNVDSGSMVTRDGQTVGVYNYDHKIRRDHFMKSGPEEQQVKRYVGRRVLPEVRKAFNYDVTRREDFRIACYDAGRGGYFRPHRDNTTEATAHRRFALSLLLSDDYEGGHLRFPEFGRDLYRPRAGGAVVFSCSLLHEATDVTAGRRFVLLSFFYGESEAKAREAYNARTGGAYRA